MTKATYKHTRGCGKTRATTTTGSGQGDKRHFRPRGEIEGDSSD
jgi:hypothetical protein